MKPFLRIALLVLLTASTGLGLATGQSPGAPAPAQMTIKEVDFAQAPLRTVVDFIRKKALELNPGQGGMNIVVGVAAKDLPVTISLEDMTVEQLLKIIAEQNNLTLEKQPYAYVLDKITGATVLNSAASRGYGVPISVDFQDLSLDKAIEVIHAEWKRLDPDQRGMNIVVNPDVDQTKKMSLTLTNVPADEVLRYATELSGTVLTKSDGVLFIGKPAVKP